MSRYLVIMNYYNHIINPWIIQNTKITILLIDNYNQIIINPYKFDLIQYILSTMYLHKLFFDNLITFSLVYLK
jgi:hypothetical protein